MNAPLHIQQPLKTGPEKASESNFRMPAGLLSRLGQPPAQPHTPAGIPLESTPVMRLIQRKTAEGKVQRLTDYDRNTVLNPSFTPSHWPVSGTKYAAFTAARNQIDAWVAHPGASMDQQYWCHGHSIGSYENYGYSIMGIDAERVFADDYAVVPESRVQDGDIVSFHPAPGDSSQVPLGHSARIFAVQHRPDGRVAPNTVLSSKNGSNPLGIYSLDRLQAVYPEFPRLVFRRRTASGPAAPVVRDAAER